MHPKFARRLARIARDKRKAHGQEAVGRWWGEVFPRLDDVQFAQVMRELQRLPR